MRKYRLKIYILLISFNFSAQSDSTKVLFIGNSITYFNDMPWMFRNIANNQGKKVSVTMYAPGGTGFVDHYTDPNVYDLFRNNVWDIVALQPGTNESRGTSWPVNTTITRGHTMLDSIYYHSPCAQVYLYQIPYALLTPTSYPYYFQVQDTYRDSVQKMNDSLKTQIIAAGECARAYYERWPNLLLHNSYGDIHPSPYGSFLTASAFYSTIFQDSVSDCTYYANIPIDTCRKFFEIADSVILQHFSNWRINTYNLHAGFTFNQQGNSISFTNSSSNYNNVMWSFGDEESSTSTNSNHTFTSNGTYEVKLYAINNTCIDSVSQFITINTTGLNDHKNSVSKIVPNPNNGVFALKLERPQSINSINIYSCIGELIETISVNKTIDNYKFDTNNFSKGIYYIEIIGENVKMNNKCVVE